MSGSAFGGDGQDAGDPGRDSLTRLEGVEIVGQQVEVGLADALRKDDAVGLAPHDDGEVVQGEAGIEGIHADIELGAGAVGALQIGKSHVTGDRLAIGGDRIL